MNFLNHVLKNILCIVAGRKVIIPSCVDGMEGKEGECKDKALLLNGQRTSSSSPLPDGHRSTGIIQ